MIKLHVQSREYTGVGSYTNFSETNSLQELSDGTLGLKGMISMPELKNGLGAVLFSEKGRPKILEIFTYGDEHWDETFEGFVISDYQ